MLTFQLLSKDGSSLDDAEVLSGRWQAYVEGFVSETETSGVPASKVRRPFLRRSVVTPSPPPYWANPLLSHWQITARWDDDGQGPKRRWTGLLRARWARDQGVRADVSPVLCLADRGRAVARAGRCGARARSGEAR